ncbi:MAG: mechanosensitive ion channel family protein [Actinomycetota bacterium]|nr:mechanosensitive ion channel family protein [Actinomycetota bacterium]
MDLLAQTDTTEVDLTEVVPSGVEGEDWLHAGIVVAATIVGTVVIARLLRRLVERTLGTGFAPLIISRAAAYGVFLIGVTYALGTLGVRVGPLLGALGLGGLVLALALQALVENLVSGMFIQARRPFTIGDTVTSGDHTGVVVDVNARTTVLRTVEGVWIHVPNANVLKEPIVNLTKEALRRSELLVGVAYDSDLHEAISVTREAIGRATRVAKVPAPQVVVQEFGDSSIVLSCLYWHQADIPAEVVTRGDVALAIHEAYEDAGITIAFPQMVLWTGVERSDGGPYADRDLGRIGPAPQDKPPVEPPSSLGRLRRRGGA